MSDADRQRWNERYRLGAYADREHASPWLLACLPRAPTGRALDVACGAGRNALCLAERGYAVTGVDISGEALSRARRSARTRGLTVEWIERDLDTGPGVRGPFDLIVLVRYVDLALLPALCGQLAPAGCLVVEEHLATERDDVAGPRNPAFRVSSGALRRAAGDLEVIDSFEGEVSDPDGRPAMVARLFARRPASGGAGR
ncbi:MAG: methyltransferase domain-containing protein [Gammaproteobacteria bacterium]|nr:methyltransferase domain-containing protein [Gammaproteobacteria bacterium]